MTEAQSLFIERKSEIEIYFDFLKLILIDNNISQINSDLQKILKANSFILLYNLIESSTSKAIEDIYLDLKVKSIEFKNLKEGIKKTIIKSIRKNVNSDKFECDSKMETIWNCFESTSIFQGNVDARNIKEIAREYGFSTNTNAELTKDGEKLLTVKSKRNDLAHGYISFLDCGRDYTFEDLNIIKDQVLKYLEQILENINKYIENQEYIKS